MKFDDVLSLTGEFGRYQWTICIILFACAIASVMNHMAQVFFVGTMDHWCAVEEWNEYVTYCERFLNSNLSFYTTCIHEMREACIPQMLVTEELSWEKCLKYDDNYTREWQEGFNSTSTDHIQCNVGWVFDKTQFESTIISDFQLVCDDQNLPVLSQSLYFAGILIGAFLFGSLADWIGRCLTFFICVGLTILFSILTTISTSFWMFAISRFFIGMTNFPIFTMSFILVTELAGPSKRVLAGILIQACFSVGIMLLALTGYLVREWRIIQFVSTCAITLILLLIPVIPESPRWLISRDKFDKAKVIILKMAKYNKQEGNLPDDYMEKLKEREQERKSSSYKIPSFLDIFRNPRMRWRATNLMYNWFVNSFVYYGLSLSTSDLGSNIYVTFFISGAVEIPATILSIFAMQSFLGRRYALIGSELISGFACLLAILLPLGPWKTTIVMIGKLGISASFGIVGLFTAELFPTPLRSIAIGICSTASRVGGVVVSVCFLLVPIWESFPLILFGGSVIIAALLAILLPETRGTQLPETILEGEFFGIEKKKTFDNDSGKNKSEVKFSSLRNPVSVPSLLVSTIE